MYKSEIQGLYHFIAPLSSSWSLVNNLTVYLQGAQLDAEYVHMTGNARLRSRRLRYKAAVHVPDFDTLVSAPELSLPIQVCRLISKGSFFLHP